MRKTAEQLSTFEDVHKVLENYIPPIRSNRGAYTLERMQALMASLGNPQNSYKVVHVAGTSGKTSTCYYMAAFIKASGKKVGLSVSPHIDEINERVQINIKPLAEKAFCREFSIFLRLVEKINMKPTYFELLTAFAYWEFQRQACDYVVVEVGLGGLLDATNVITRNNKVNIITDIGLDHEEVLGKSLPSIATQKAGIIKPHNTVVCYEQEEEIMNVIRETANQQQAQLHEIWPIKNSELPRSLPLFQRRNWYLAYSCYVTLADRDELPEFDEEKLLSSVKTYIPARMEIYRHNPDTIILDGSHNQQKIATLVKSIKHQYKRQKFVILLSLLSTKQAKILQCLEELLPICDKLFITSFSTSNNVKVSVDPLKIVAACEKLEFQDWEVVNDPVLALKKLMNNPNPHKLVTGSFYLLNHIRPLIMAK